MSSKTSTKKQFVVVGAGISGLALGWYLKNRFTDEIDLTIIDSEERPGGWIKTLHCDDFLFEVGPRSCRPYGNGVETLKLIEELGMQNELVFASPEAAQRYIYINKELKALPKGLLSLPFSSFALPLLKAFWNDLTTKKCDHEKDESIFDFVSRRLGKDMADLFFDPLVSGIYAGDITKLSMKSCFPVIHEWEQRKGWLLGGALMKRKKHTASAFVLASQKKGLFTLQNGMESLILTLADKLKNSLRLGCKVTAIEMLEDEGQAKILLENQDPIFADHLFMAIPPSALAPMMQLHSSEVFNALNGIPSNSVGVVNLGYQKRNLKFRGFGYLIPSKEQQEVLGIVWDSSAFPSQNKCVDETRLTVMIGNAHLTKCLKGIALKAISEHLKIQDQPDSISITIAKNAVPQYHVGHSARLQIIEEGLRNLPVPITLLGNGYYGVAVNDCIAKAKSIANATLK